ncbi:MAG: hypothetical protein HQ559_11765 [Lentisphaerae bacterium]|nr:hypothetical protein [Lentisphaerota bacterium]
MKYMFVALVVLTLFAGCSAQEREYSRAAIAMRHGIVVPHGKTGGRRYQATYAKREIVPLHLVGTNGAEIAATLGRTTTMVGDRYVPDGGTYEEVHLAFDAVWYVTYSHDGQPVKIERAIILRDAQANKTLEDARQ